MKFRTYYFYFNSPLHIGNPRPEGYERSESFLHSDTISAAVLNAWAKLGYTDWIEECEGNPGFTISSAFPFYRNGDAITHFFPRPLIQWNRTFDPDLSKRIKNVQWLDQRHFQAVIKNESLESLGQDNEFLQGNYLSNTSIPRNFIVKESQDRVVVPRDYSLTKDARPFVMERLRFDEGAGFYILVCDNDTNLRMALEFLQYEGFGTDRAVGNGLYDLNEGEIEIDVPGDPNMSINLGLYCPESREILQNQINDCSSYHILKRGGWITSDGNQTLEKNSVYMFGEGSVFASDNIIEGVGNLKLTPPAEQLDHEVYRSGRSIFIPVKIDK